MGEWRYASMRSEDAPVDDKSAIVQVVAAVSAVLAVVTGLAVTGVLAEAQRNNGAWLLGAFAGVLLGATLWLLGVSAGAGASKSGPASNSALEWWPVWAWLGRLWHWFYRPDLLQPLGLVAVAIALGFAIYALIRTQSDFERPDVAASFSQANNVLTADVTDHGLNSEDRLAIRISAVAMKPKENFPTEGSPLYLAEIGPDASGDLDQKIDVRVPKRVIYWVGRPGSKRTTKRTLSVRMVVVKAWTADEEQPCTQREKNAAAAPTTPAHKRLVLRRAREAGCLILRVR